MSSGDGDSEKQINQKSHLKYKKNSQQFNVIVFVYQNWYLQHRYCLLCEPRAILNKLHASVISFFFLN